MAGGVRRLSLWCLRRLRRRNISRPGLDLRHKPGRDSLLAHKVVVPPADSSQLVIGDFHDVSGAACDGEPVGPIGHAEISAQNPVLPVAKFAESATG
jgi:hypothetical protein